MRAQQHYCAAAQGLAAPVAATTPQAHKDEPPRLAGAEGLREGKADKPDFQGTRFAGQALRAIEGHNKAVQYLARLQAQQADPEELALIVAALYGAALHGFCRAIEKALGVRHG